MWLMSEPSRKCFGRTILESRKNIVGILLNAIKHQKVGHVVRMSEPSSIEPLWRIHVDSRKDTRMYILLIEMTTTEAEECDGE